MISIIFVDDLPISTKRAQEAFRAVSDRYGITCAITVTDTVEGFLACVARQDYDIYIIDIDLPETRGDKLIQAVRAINPLATIAFLSFYNSYGNMAVDNHIDAYLYKTYDDNDMKECATKLLKKCATKRQHYRFRTVSGVVDVAITDILYIASNRRSIYVHMRDGAIFNVYNETLKGLHEQTHFWQFVRVSRGLLVNIKNMVEIDTNNNMIWMCNGESLKGNSRATHDFLLAMQAEIRHNREGITHLDVDTLKK